MGFRAGLRDPCTWDIARFSESVKIHSPAARVFLPFPKISQHPALRFQIGYATGILKSPYTEQ